LPILPRLLILYGVGKGSAALAVLWLSAAGVAVAEEKPVVRASALEERLASLEKKLAEIDARLVAALRELDEKKSAELLKGRDVPVPAHPADTFAAGPAAKARPRPDGFSEDETSRVFRDAMVLLDGGKSSEAILAFSGFLKRFPDHPFAGSAQFYAGEAYLSQKEYSLAAREYQRVLVSYDRNCHVPDALLRLAETAGRLKNGEEAERHTHRLRTLFPHSPAAKSLVRGEGRGILGSDLLRSVLPGSGGKRASADTPAAENAGFDEPPPSAPVPGDSQSP